MPVLPVVLGGARFAPLLLRIPFVKKAVRSAGRSAGKAARSRSASKPAAKPTVKKPSAKPAPTYGPKDILTRGERAQERLARYGRVTTRGERAQEAQIKLGRARAAQNRFRATAADSARQVAQGSGRVRGTGKVQKSPGKPTKQVRQGMKPPATEAQRIAGAPWRGRRSGKPKTVTGVALVGGAAALAAHDVTSSFKGKGKGSGGSTSSAARLSREHTNRPSVRVPRPGGGSGPSGYGSGGTLRVDGTTPGPSVGRVTKLKPKTSSGSGSGSARPSGGRGAGGAGYSGGGPGKGKGKGKGKTSVPTVSQSNTMWVKKGDMVGGQAVQKGYLAQYGKAEKRVSAKVNIVADTVSGKKVGETYKYAKGRTVKKVRKK